MNTRTFIKSVLLIGAAPQIIVPQLTDRFHWKAPVLWRPYFHIYPSGYLFCTWAYTIQKARQDFIKLNNDFPLKLREEEFKSGVGIWTTDRKKALSPAVKISYYANSLPLDMLKKD